MLSSDHNPASCWTFRRPGIGADARWCWIMTAIRLIPESIGKQLKF